MSSQTVLVVDDQPNMRRILELMLKQMGYTVLQAKNGRLALDILTTVSVDLVITDLCMPELDGLGLLRQLREQNNEVSVIVVTAKGTVGTAVEAMKYGACDYIERPFELETVEAAVQRALKLNAVQRENRYLRQQVDKGWGEFIGDSPKMQEIYTLIQQVAPTRTGVLIQGETGTGKELVARAIHRASPRADSLFVPINCAAIPADILESELFGYSKGAFTGAHKDRVGKFELANGGTLFLDEITEMDFNIQAKILRVLQERSLERLGSNKTISVDIRVIAACNRDPQQAIEDKKLREDLFYRLNVFNILLPPLRERNQDIVPLARHFLKKHAAEFGYDFAGLEAEAEAVLMAYHWPGNVREMENMMERAIVLSGGKPVSITHLPHDVQALNSSSPPMETVSETGVQDLTLSSQLERVEKRIIEQALEKAGGNKTKAARLLQISERSLWYKLKKYQ